MPTSTGQPRAARGRFASSKPKKPFQAFLENHERVATGSLFLSLMQLVYGRNLTIEFFTRIGNPTPSLNGDTK
jgi:hypothetical protein